MRILGICGSLRTGSYNHALLRALGAALPPGAEFEEAGIGDLPLFNQDFEKENYPTAAAALKDRIRAADGVIIATPEYNRSVPGVLKNAVDWTSRPFSDSAWEEKPLFIVSASTGSISGALAAYDLKRTMLYLNARLLSKPEVMVGQARERFGEDGVVTDEKTKEILANAAALFAAFAARP